MLVLHNGTNTPSAIVVTLVTLPALLAGHFFGAGGGGGGGGEWGSDVMFAGQTSDRHGAIVTTVDLGNSWPLVDEFETW